MKRILENTLNILFFPLFFATFFLIRYIGLNETALSFDNVKILYIFMLSLRLIMLCFALVVFFSKHSRIYNIIGAIIVTGVTLTLTKSSISYANYLFSLGMDKFKLDFFQSIRYFLITSIIYLVVNTINLYLNFLIKDKKEKEIKEAKYESIKLPDKKKY